MIGEIGFIGYPPFALEVERLAFWFSRDAIGQGVRQLLDLRNGLDERTVDVHIGRLRKTIHRAGTKDPIRTVRGAGYSFNEHFATASA
jgi:DNA-binding response OmpR family regulator